MVRALSRCSSASAVRSIQENGEGRTVRPGCVLLDWGDTLMVDFPQYGRPYDAVAASRGGHACT